MEDLVFQRMLEHDDSLQEILATLVKEHEGLAQKGGCFKDALEHVVDGVLVSRAELETQGRDYLEFLRYHMGKEERQVFPTAQQVLNDTDWSWIATAMEAREDPVFGATVEQQFRSLYEHIRQHGS
jgi:hemerythrin-like domain-containing protein